MSRRPGAPSPLPYADLAVPPVRLDRDVAPGQARALCARGQWVRVRRGAYVDAFLLDTDPHLRARQMVMARIVAVLRQSALDVVASHASAAVVWGLPLVAVPGRTHVVQSTRPAGNAASDVARHVRRPDDLVAVVRRGVRVTTLARTAVDCALTLGGRGGLVVADAALAAGATREECERIVAGLGRVHGLRVARQVVALADDGAESAGESHARWALLRLGLPMPQTQVPVETRLGTYWADLGWPEWRLLLEYDGVAKYGADARDAVQAVLAEKRRQEAIEEAGWRVVRLVAADLRRPDLLARRLRPFLPSGVLERLQPRPYL